MSFSIFTSKFEFESEPIKIGAGHHILKFTIESLRVNLNSTLMSMSIFLLLNWVIKEIDKIQRKFLCMDTQKNTSSKYMSPISWKMVEKRTYN
jgi:hypothetical protein